MIRSCLFLLFLAFFLLSCEKEDNSTCQLDAATCVRVHNSSGVDLQAVRLRTGSVDDYVLLGDLWQGLTTEFVAQPDADWCNYRLEALDANEGVYVGGDWICAQPDPLGVGAFTIVLTLGTVVPAEFTYLESELIR